VSGFCMMTVSRTVNSIWWVCHYNRRKNSSWLPGWRYIVCWQRKRPQINRREE